MADKRDEHAKKDDNTPLIQIDDSKKGAASAAPARRRRLLAGIASAACVVLIVVSLGFVHPAAGGAWSLAWIAESLQSGGVARSEPSASGLNSSDGASSSSKGASAKSEASSNAKDKAKDESKSSSKDSQQDSPAESKGEDSSSNRSSDTAASGGASSPSSNQGAGPHASGGSSSGGSSGAAGSGASGSGGSSDGGSQDDGLIAVTVSVTSSAVGNPVSAGGTYTFKQGATVYDALCALGLSVNAHGSAYGTYVAAIGGLAEKEHGSSSGWMYSVNGSTPMVACSGYTLSNGDNVVWYYVTG